MYGVGASEVPRLLKFNILVPVVKENVMVGFKLNICARIVLACNCPLLESPFVFKI